MGEEGRTFIFTLFSPNECRCSIFSPGIIPLHPLRDQGRKRYRPMRKGRAETWREQTDEDQA